MGLHLGAGCGDGIRDGGGIQRAAVEGGLRLGEADRSIIRAKDADMGVSDRAGGKIEMDRDACQGEVAPATGEFLEGPAPVL